MTPEEREAWLKEAEKNPGFVGYRQEEDGLVPIIILTREQLNWKPTTPEEIEESKARHLRWRKEIDERRRQLGLEDKAADSEKKK